MLHETHVVTACNCPAIDLIICAELRNDRLIDVTKLLSDSFAVSSVSYHYRIIIEHVTCVLAMQTQQNEVDMEAGGLKEMLLLTVGVLP